jgi:co-chaperonin GroES (HSP10)
MKIKRVGEDRYFIKPDTEKNTKTKSGIIVDTSDDARSYNTGVIMHKGLGRTDDKTKLVLPFEVGDRVMYEPRNQVEIMVDDGKLVVIRETNIICSYDV